MPTSISPSRRQLDPDSDGPRSVRPQTSRFLQSYPDSLSSSAFKYSSPSGSSRTRTLPHTQTIATTVANSLMMAAPPAQVAGVQPPPSSDATVAKPAPTSLPCAPRVRYIGVQQSPCGQWTAHVLDQDQGAVRVIGPFPDEHAAALAHDRVAITFYGPGAHLNFKPAFYTIELLFLLRCRKQQGDMDVCAIVADGTYEARYAAFLRAVIALEQYGEFMDVMVQFYIDRAKEIGKEALVAGGEKLAAKFVEMHRNKAVDPAWRDSYLRKIAQFIAEKQQQSMEQKASDSSSTVLSRS